MPLVHAAAYAVVSYQTAYLKYYYPVEFMAALMTSVIEMPAKVADISMCAVRWELQSCRLILIVECTDFLLITALSDTVFLQLKA